MSQKTTMRELRPTLTLLQTKGVKLLIHTGGRRLHWKGLLADNMSSFGSANWTGATLSNVERVCISELTPEQVDIEEAAYEDLFETSEPWKIEASTPLRSTRSLGDM